MKPLNVLVVDDIVMNRFLIKEILSGLGYHSQQAANGKEAIKMLKTVRFDLLFMDIEMPVMNGLETTRYIRDEMPAPYSRIPIIALTAHDPYMYFNDFRKAGFDNLLTKPYTCEQIKNVLEKCLIIPGG